MAKRKKRKSASRELQERIFVRYRGDGHVRFQIPDDLCSPAAGAALESGLGATEGIYRVIVYQRAGKLSVRYMETVLDFREVALALAGVLDALADKLPLGEMPIEEKTSSFRERFSDLGPVRHIRSRYEDLKEKARMAGTFAAVRSGLPIKVNIDVEQTTINFLNDLVAFYLIKVHWTQITQLWLRQPIKYRYPLLTMIYLVFLMVRYRKANPRKALPDKTKPNKTKTAT